MVLSPGALSVAFNTQFADAHLGPRFRPFPPVAQSALKFCHVKRESVGIVGCGYCGGRVSLSRMRRFGLVLGVLQDAFEVFWAP